jgi:LacI family transcriptional regulator
MVGRSVRIAEVAATAGVGVGTVSRVLNNSAHVREDTRRRVLAVIDQLGYRRSRLGFGLSMGQTGSVAVLVPFMTRPSVVERLAGALAVLDGEGYDTIVCNIESADQRDRHLTAFAERHRADGLVVISLPLPRSRIEGMREAGIPLVLVDTESSGAPRVTIDNVAGGRLAGEHLLALGHTRIGFIGDATSRSWGFFSTARRLAGFREALRRHGVSADPDLVRLGAHGTAEAAEMAIDLLGGRDPPTAIFAASDTQGIGVLQAAQRLRRQVPGDVSVVGFDDIEAAGMLQLTTVRQPLRASGELGAMRVCALMRGEPDVPLRTLLPLELVQRASTGPGPDVLQLQPMISLTEPSRR